MKIRAIFKSLLSLNIFHYVVAIVCLFGIIIRTKLYLFNNSFWLDEISLANNILGRSYKEIFEPFLYSQVSPPLFSVLSKFILDISGQANDIYNRDLALRLLPFLSSIISIPLFCIFVQNNFKNKYFTVVSSLLVSINPILIGYSAEFKQYSVELLCAIILLIAFSSINVEKDSIKKIVGYSILFCIITWFSFSSFFILGAGFFYLLMKFIAGKFENKKKYMIIFLSSYFHFIFYYFCVIEPYYFKTYEDMYRYWGSAIPSFMSLSNFVEMFISKTFEVFNIFQAPQTSAIIFCVFLFVFISRKKLRDNFLVVLPIFLTIITSFFKFYPYECRLILFLIPMFVVIYSSFVFLLKENKITSIVIYVSAVAIAFTQFLVPIHYRIVHPDSSRELYLEMKSEDEKLDNIFSADANTFVYYSFIDKTMNAQYKYLFDQDSNIVRYEQELEKIPVGKEYWAYSPVGRISFDSKVKRYLLTNPNITILKIYESPKSEMDCAIKFKKNN